MQKRVLALVSLFLIIFLLSISFVSAAWYSGFVDFYNKITGRVITGKVVAPECVTGADCPSGTGCVFVNEEYGKRCLDCASPYLCAGGPPTSGHCGIWGNNCNCGTYCALGMCDGVPCKNGVCNNPTGEGFCIECTPNWQCGVWSECVGGTQIRKCSDLAGCEADKTETQSCEAAACTETDDRIDYNNFGITTYSGVISLDVCLGDGKTLTEYYCVSSTGPKSSENYDCSKIGRVCRNGACVAGDCNPQCSGKECGSDSCGGSCGSCASGKECSNGNCVSTCIPDCTGRVCGPDPVCGKSCGTCATGFVCANGQCAACVLSIEVCDGRDNDCDSLIDEETCEVGESCELSEGSWKCVESCSTDCGDTECGTYIICENVAYCGLCGENEVCSDGKCVEEKEEKTIYSTKSGYVTRNGVRISYKSLNYPASKRMQFDSSRLPGMQQSSNSDVHYEWFDLSSIPKTAIINLAKITKFAAKVSNAEYKAELYPIIESYPDLEALSYSTKNRFLKIGDKLGVDSVNIALRDNKLEYNVTEYIQKIVNGQVNYGFAFYGAFYSGSNKNFYLRNSNESVKPRIEINYCVPSTCKSLGKQCGNWSDGCGGNLNCGGCLNTPQTPMCSPSGSCVECLGDVNCDDNNPCTIDSCNLSTFTCAITNDCGERVCGPSIGNLPGCSCGNCSSGYSCSLNGLCILSNINASINLSTVKNVYNVGEKVELTPGGN